MNKPTKLYFTIPETPIACEWCKIIGNVVCAYNNKHMIYHCRGCNKRWETGLNFSVIRQKKSETKPASASFLGVFYGPWLSAEVHLIEDNMKSFVEVHDLKEEWGFYKGRFFYSGWRYSSDSSKVILAETPVALVAKVTEKCVQLLKL